MVTSKSRRRSRLARPNRGGDRVSAARSSGSSLRTGPRTRSKRRFTAAFSAVQIPSEILASVPRSARSSGSSPSCLEPPRSRRILASALGAAPRTPAALRRVSNPDQIPSEVAFSAPPRPPAPAALRRAVSNRPDHDLDRVFGRPARGGSWVFGTSSVTSSTTRFATGRDFGPAAPDRRMRGETTENERRDDGE
ncbi:hypothetical protein VNO78_12422 [Psophocarpus tetragonolobus]|uniref:Uncharacterized protein n=1 Tax=Psophocarpus tetragonolobus TaxID=3891 RepID=A0AAN9XNY8_PSOTE